MRHIVTYPDVGAGVTFVRIPKAASRSVILGFFDRQRAEYGKVNSPSFAIVRNPYDRFASCLAMFSPGGRFAIDDLTASDVLARLRRDDFSGSHKHEVLREHCLPMMHSYFQLNKVDRIFRFENLAEEWRNIAEFIGASVSPMPHVGPRQVAISLTDADRETVREIYAEDFEAFGYDRQ